jgi:hypothetical protein
MSTTAIALAEVLRRALKASSPKAHVSSGDLTSVIVDGTFDLISVAEQILAEMEPGQS